MVTEAKLWALLNLKELKSKIMMKKKSKQGRQEGRQENREAKPHCDSERIQSAYATFCRYYQALAKSASVPAGKDSYLYTQGLFDMKSDRIFKIFIRSQWLIHALVQWYFKLDDSTEIRIHNLNTDLSGFQETENGAPKMAELDSRFKITLIYAGGRKEEHYLNVEMQNYWEEHLSDRIFYYGIRMGNEALRVSDNYQNLASLISLVLTDFIPSGLEAQPGDYLSSAHMMFEKEHVTLHKRRQTAYLVLPNFNLSPEEIDKRGCLFLATVYYFMNSIKMGPENFLQFMRKGKVMAEAAMRIAETIDGMRRLDEHLLAMKERSIIKGLRAEGRAEGKEEGRPAESNSQCKSYDRRRRTRF